MKQKRGPWDGAQPRKHVLDVLRAHGVTVVSRADDFYLLLDNEGDPEVLHIPNPVLSKTIEHLYRRFGHLHGFEITELVKRRH